MLCLTKIKRGYVIDHVMPSDLDEDDIRHGLLLKEEMINKITDDYIKENYPNWKEIEYNYRKYGLTDIIDKIICGEMTNSDIQTYKPVQMDVWMRWKEFKEGNITPKKRSDEYQRYETYDFDRLDGYCDWIECSDKKEFILYDKYDIMVQFQLAIVGENCIRYYPFQDSGHYNGLAHVDDNLQIYDPQVWPRNEDDGKLKDKIENQEQYYRFIFKNYKGYYNFKFDDDYTDWIQSNYPDQEVRTLQTDPIRIKYIGETKPAEQGEPYGADCLITARQFIKSNYKTVMLNLCSFDFRINNLHMDEE